MFLYVLLLKDCNITKEINLWRFRGSFSKFFVAFRNIFWINISSCPCGIQVPHKSKEKNSHMFSNFSYQWKNISVKMSKMVSANSFCKNIKQHRSHFTLFKVYYLGCFYHWSESYTWFQKFQKQLSVGVL